MSYKIEVQNLKCGGCANTIKNGLSKLTQVSSVEVDHENGFVTVELNSEEELHFVTDKLIKLGYPPVGEENHLFTKAKSFASCAIGKVS